LRRPRRRQACAALPVAWRRLREYRNSL
jgi:hypothetical protein